MSHYIINGGKKLSGEINVAGSKNAVLALIAACLLTDEECIVSNVPGILDVQVMLDIVAELGVRVQYDRINKTLVLQAETIQRTELNQELTKKLRASVLLLGPLLARCNSVTLGSTGGDKIGARSISTHIAALKDLGAECLVREGFHFSTSGLVGATIVLEETSVTATENALMAAVIAHGTTVIKLAATEPHVQQLAEFLNTMGAKISGIGNTTLTIEGVSKLRGARIAVIPDANEAASFITLAAASKSNIIVTGVPIDYLDDFLLKLKKMGVMFDIGKDWVHVLHPLREYQATKLQVGLYPKLCSDDMPPLAVLATQAVGETNMYEWLYENRLGYAPELNTMGARTEILDSHRVKITGPTPLKASKLTVSDIRMGMALVIAALIAEGESEISEIQHIDRGYEKLEERLNRLGADIVRIK